jgi:pyrroloquinoline quinone (PQQ) biosynthesis protein C
MSFFDRLIAATETERAALGTIPIVQGCLAGRVSLASYTAFLTQAYHHVSQTVPLLQACRLALPARLYWMRADLDEYIVEESGHDRWILDDLRVCGVSSDTVTGATPAFATEVMIAYAFDTIERGNPVGFLGMVHVLEGTSVSLALRAADSIQKALGLPPQAFSYLRSHGILDREHTAHFAHLMDRLDNAGDQAAVVHAAKMFYRLYSDVLRSLPLPAAAAAIAA